MMMIIRRAVTTFAFVSILIAPAWAGPVILAGHDPDSHGFETVYAGLFNALLRNVTNGQSGILAIGANPGTTAATWITTVASQMNPAQSVTFVNEAAISSVDFSQFAILHIPSDSANTFGGINPSENSRLVARATDIANFINTGGGLFGLTQGELANAYGYLSFFGIISTLSAPPTGVLPSGQFYDNVSATAAGSSFGITDTNVDGCCWHNVFTAFPSFLAVLATANEPADPPFNGQAAVLGGTTVTVGPPAFGVAGGASRPWGMVAEPINTATGNYVFQRTDLAIPGRGVPIIFTRTYNSLDNFIGPFGKGWTHSYNILLTETLDGSVRVKHGDGHEEFYDPTGGGAFVPRFGGVFSTLFKNADGTFTLTLKNQTQYGFTAAGKLNAIADRNGNTVSFSYDGSGNLIQITDTVGRIITLTYNASNQLGVVEDPIGRTVAYSYDGNGNLATVTDPSGGVMSFSYDSNRLLREIRDERGNQLVVNTYDGAGRVSIQANSRGFTTTLTYDFPNPGDTTIVDPRGNPSVHTHDTLFRLLGITDAEGGVTSFTYDTNNNRTSIKDQNGNTTLFAYEANGNVLSITDPLGNPVSFTYDSHNNLTSATNARGFTTTFNYDPAGNLKTIQDALTNTTAFDYDGFGQLTRKTDAPGNQTQYGYDGQGNLIRITDALGGITTLGYDAIGRLLRLTDPNGNTATPAYDLNSRLTRIVDPLKNTTLFAYDSVGNLGEITDAKGNKTRYAYDEVNNLRTVTDALGHVTHYTYDENNNRISITNANSHTTAYGFDTLNRLVSITDPLGNVTTYSHDPVGNVTRLTDANAITNTFGYDANNRLGEIAYGDGNTVIYFYDANGNRSQMTDARGTTIYEYDALDRLLAVTNPEGIVQYGYDAVGNRTSLTYPDGKLAIFTYDALNRLQQVTDWNGRVTTYTYDRASNLTEILYPNGRMIGYSFDAANRLLKVAHKLGLSLMAEFNYTLDALGNRTRKATKLSLNPLPLTATKTETYVYDALSQLIRTEEALFGTPVQSTTYKYDPFGNRLRLEQFRFGQKGALVPAGTTEYAYDAADRLLRAGSTIYTYDNNGNRLTEAGKRNAAYVYDAANRLVQVEQGSAQVGYVYDGDGNKVQRTENNGKSIETVRFLNDVATALPVILAEHDNKGTIAYAYGLGLIAEEVSSNRGSPTTFFFHADGLGNTVALSDEKGRPRTAYEYDPWGELELSLGAVPNRFLFTGEDLDAETGLYYLRARWYDASVGRFISKDPFGGSAVFPHSANRYIYAFNNPINFTDKTGLDPAGGAFGERFLNSVLKKSAAELASGLVRMLGGIHAEHSLRDPSLIGRIFGKISAYIGPTFTVVVDPAIKAHADNIAHPERDVIEKWARFSIDVTAGSLISLAVISTGGTAGFVGQLVTGAGLGAGYEATRTQIQDVILYNPITNKAGEFLFNNLHGTRLGGWLGL